MEAYRYVNIKQGTNSTRRFSNGNTLPYVQMPFGMASFTLQTDSNRGDWFYHPHDESVEGIRLTHQPSPWMGDYGQMIFMPQSGKPYVTAESRWSSYEELAMEPGYLACRLLRYQTEFELVPTERGARMRVRYLNNDAHRFMILPFEFPGKMEYCPKTQTVSGYTEAAKDGAPAGFREYFVIRFHQKALEEECMSAAKDGSCTPELCTSEDGQGIVLTFAEDKIEADFVISYISEEQALVTLQRELAGKSLDELRTAAKKAWEDMLSRIVVTGEESLLCTFYSCMYHIFVFPRKCYEITEAGQTVHCSMKDNSVADGVAYTDNGFWDTFRTTYPMYAIIAPELYEEIVTGYVNFYQDTGWLPKWLSPGERGTMPGTLIDAVIADGAVKGILKGELLKKAYEGLLSHAKESSTKRLFGRHGMEPYLEKGYIPCDAYKEAANHTLDYVYGDFCISQIAGVLGDKKTQEQFIKRGQYYKNLYDGKTPFMRPRKADGTFDKIFDPYTWGNGYCEGSAWQNGFAVYHDIEGMAELFGGKDVLRNQIYAIFESDRSYRVGSYGQEIHEMTEMAKADFGQCAISNQPSFHLPYIPFFLDDVGFARKQLHKILTEGFSSREDGFPGDEDNGSMSAWFVFGALGIYPFCPGKTEYLLGTPLVTSAVISLSNGKMVEINGCHGVAEKVSINGKESEASRISHEQLTEGVQISFWDK